MTASFVLGVDGGNTKTLALVAAQDGSVLGVGRGKCSDIYGAPSVSAALDEIATAVGDALEGAGLDVTRLASVACSLAGVDWPEDETLYRTELTARLGAQLEPVVVNDAIGALWSGSPRGVGVSIACGTWNAIGARSADGRAWHSSFWIEPSGAMGLGRDAFRAVCRSALGLAEPTSLTAGLLTLYGVPDTESLLHRFTRRDDRPQEEETARAAGLLLDEADRGDPTAVAIIRRHGRMLGEYAIAAARKVRLLGEPFPVVLAGGLFNHSSSLLEDAIVEAVQRGAPEAAPRRAELPPVAGAALIALDRAGLALDDTVLTALRSSVAELRSSGRVSL